VAGKVTVGLASHWPCDTDFSGLSTYGLNGHREGDEHPFTLRTGAWSTFSLSYPWFPPFRCRSAVMKIPYELRERRKNYVAYVKNSVAPLPLPPAVAP